MRNEWGRLPFISVAPGTWKDEFTQRALQSELWGITEPDGFSYVARGGRVDEMYFGPANGTNISSSFKVICGSLMNGTITESDGVTGNLHTTVFDHHETNPVSWMKIDGFRIVVGHLDGKISVFSKPENSAGTSSRSWKMKSFHARFNLLSECYSVVKDKAVTVDTQGVCRIFELNSEPGDFLEIPLGRNQNDISCVHYDTLQQNVLLGYQDGRIISIDQSGALVQTFEGHMKPITAIRCEGTLMLALSNSECFRIWSTETARCLCVLTGNIGSVTQFEWGSENGQLVGGSNNGDLHFWNCSKGTQIVNPIWTQVGAHQGKITALSLDRYKVISGGIDGETKIWEVLNGKLLRTLDKKMNKGNKCPNTRGNEEGLIQDLGVEGRRILSITRAGRVRWWFFSGKMRTNLVQQHHQTNNTHADSSAKKKKATLPKDESLQLQVLEGYEEVVQEKAHKAYVSKQLSSNRIEGLSEQEMIQYAMMLSLEEEKKGQQKPKQVPVVQPKTEQVKPKAQSCGKSFAPEASLDYFLLSQMSEELQMSWALKQSVGAS